MFLTECPLIETSGSKPSSASELPHDIFGSAHCLTPSWPVERRDCRFNQSPRTLRTAVKAMAASDIDHPLWAGSLRLAFFELAVG